jgi:hypothetical protein
VAKQRLHINVETIMVADWMRFLKIACLPMILVILSLLMLSSCEQKPETADNPDTLVNETRRDVGIETAQYDWSEQVLFLKMHPGQIEAVDQTHIWVTDDNNNSIYFYDGSSWVQQCTTNLDLTMLYAANENCLWAIGNDYDEEQYAILFFDGATWSEQYRTSSCLRDICGIDTEHAWAVGDGLFSYDGSTWSQEPGFSENMVAVAAQDKDHAWACGDNSCWFFDGTSWQEQYETEIAIKDISLFSTGRAWMLCSERSQGEQGWDATSQFLLFKDGRWRKAFEVEDELEYVEAVDGYHAWAWRQGDLHFAAACYYFDGGTWSKIEPGDLFNVYCISPLGPHQALFTGGWG